MVKAIFWYLTELSRTSHSQQNIYFVICWVPLLSHINSLQSHGLWPARLPSPSSTPLACSNSCPLSRQCHPAISSSVIPFSSHLQSFPASGSCPMRPLSVVRIRWSKYCRFSFSINTSNEYSGLISFRIDWFALLAVQGTLKSILQKHQFFGIQLSLWSTSLHPYVTTGKTIALTIWAFVSKVMSLIFNTCLGLS